MGKYISSNDVIFNNIFACLNWGLYIIMAHLNKHIKILAEKLVKTVNEEDNDYDAVEEIHDILMDEMLGTTIRLDVIKYLLMDFIKSKRKNENNIRI